MIIIEGLVVNPYEGLFCPGCCYVEEAFKFGVALEVALIIEGFLCSMGGNGDFGWAVATKVKKLRIVRETELDIAEGIRNDNNGPFESLCFMAGITLNMSLKRGGRLKIFI